MFIAVALRSLEASAPINDQFANRIPLAGLGVLTNGTIVDAARQAGEPTVFTDSLGHYPAAQPVWWSWISPTSGPVTVVATMEGRSPIVAVFTGTSLSSLVQVSTLLFSDTRLQASISNSYSSEARFIAVAGTQYAIAVDGQVGVRLAWDPGPGPFPAGFIISQGRTNGIYSNIIDVGRVTTKPLLGLVDNDTNVFAVRGYSAAGLLSDFSNEVQYHVQAPTGQAAGGAFQLAIRIPPIISITSPRDGTNFATGLNIPLSVAISNASLRVVGYFLRSEDSGAETQIGLTTNALFGFGFTWSNAVGGRYLLTAKALDSFGASADSNPVAFTVGVPPNDSFSHRIELFGFPDGDTGSTVAASKEAGEPETISRIATHRTLWWGWTSAVNGPVVAVATMRDQYPSVGVFTGNSVDHLTERSALIQEDSSFSNGSFYYTSQAHFDAIAGVHYFIAVDGKEGDFSMAITAPPSIEISSPLSGSDFAPGGSIALTAQASGWEASISLVEYHYLGEDGRTGLIETVRNPESFFQAKWNNARPGRYQVTAKVIDELGAHTYSAPITVTVGRPPNDDFANRVELVGLPVTGTGSNVAASKEEGEAESIEGFNSSATVWWSWLAASNGPASVIVTMPCGMPLVGVYTGDSLSNLLEVSDLQLLFPATGTSNVTAEAQFDATAGRHYSIAVDARDGCEGPITLAVISRARVNLVNPSPNAEFASGTNISLRVSVAGGSVSRITYSFDSDSLGTEVIGVATNPPFSLLWTNVSAGRYALTATALDGFGTLSPSATAIPIVVGRPTNDNFSRRLLLTGLRASTNGSNVAAGRETLDPLLIGGSSASRIVWWSWTAPVGGSNAVVVTMPSFTPVVGVFTGTLLSNLVEVSALTFQEPFRSNQVDYYRSEARFAAQAGKTYLIAVATAYGPGSAYTLAITASPTVSIINPTNASIFASGTPVSLAVSYGDPDGSLRRVDYYWQSNGGPRVLLVTATNSPFNAVWSAPPAGRYTLSVTAMDDLGATAASAPIEISVGSPINDNFADRIDLPGEPVLTNGTTVAASMEPEEPLYLSGIPSSRTVWWNWTAPSNGLTAVLVTSPLVQPTVGVFTGSSLTGLIPVSNATIVASSSYSHARYFSLQTVFEAVAGVSYAIGVDSVDQHFTVAITAAPAVSLIDPPPGGSFVPYTNIFLGVSTSDADGRVTRVEYLADNPFYDHFLIGVATNSSFTLTWSNVPPGAYSLTARAVDNVGAFAVSSPVQISVGRPINDNFSARSTLSGSPVFASGSNAGASAEPGEPLLSDPSTGQTVWWSWTAPTTGSNAVRVTMPGNRALVRVFSGSSISNLTLVTRGVFGDPTFTNGAAYFCTEALFGSTALTTYAMAVDVQAGSGGPFDLSINALPTIRFISPLGGTDVAPGSDLTLLVDASDRDGRIVGVSLSEGYYWQGPPIDFSTNPPFSFTLTALAGGAYTFRATAFDNLGGSVISAPLSITVGRPLNDGFASRIPLVGASLTASGSNTAASRESGEPNHAGYEGHHSLWWSWSAPASANYIVSTEGSTFQTLLGIYVGTSVSNLTPIAANAFSGPGSSSWLRFDATLGTTYQIAVDGLYNSIGDIRLNLSTTPIAPNDNFADRALITGAHAVVSAYSGYATPEAGEPNHFFNAPARSLWWTWVAPASGPVVFDTFGSTFDTVLGVYKGSALTNLIVVGSDDDSSGNLASRVSFSAVVNTTYQIAVDGYKGKSGTAVLALDLTPAPISIRSLSLDGDQIRIQLDAPEGQKVLIEASSNLVDWVTISTNWIQAGMVIFSDVNGSLFEHRFYRAVLDFSLASLFIGNPEIEDGQFDLQLLGNEGAEVIVQASTNLQDWFPLTTNRITHGSVTFSDPTSNYTRRFYRGFVRD